MNLQTEYYQRLAAIIDSSDDAIISKDLHGVITSWNAGAERILGYKREEVMGRHIFLIFPEDRRPEEQRILEQIRRGEHVEQFETVRRRKDGSLVELWLRISPIKNDKGQIIGAAKVARDLETRKHWEQDCRRFITLADRCTEFIGMCDMDFNPFYVNEAALQLVGLDSLEDLRKVRVLDFFFPEDRDFIQNEFIPRVLREGSSATEVRFRHFKTGAALWMIYNVFVIKDGAGKPSAVATFSQNITRRREVEAELRDSEARLRAISTELERKVSSRTAELEERNAEVSLQTKQLRELSKRLLQVQDDAGRRIARELHDSAGQLVAALGLMLNQFSQATQHDEFARNLENSQELLRQLNSEIRTTSYLLHPPLLDETGLPQAIALYTYGLKERSGLQVELEVSDDFGRLSPQLELALFRVVQECLTNVHRHSGSKLASIRLWRDAESVLMEVQDYGAGIAAEQLLAIRTQRAGVGLTGMQERVRQFNGTLNIESEAGVTVSVHIPLATSEVA